jgi:hypothetical protein
METLSRASNSHLALLSGLLAMSQKTPLAALVFHRLGRPLMQEVPQIRRAP